MKVYLVVDMERSSHDDTYYLIFASMEAARAHLRAEAVRDWDTFPEWAPVRREGFEGYVERMAEGSYVLEQEVLGHVRPSCLGRGGGDG